MAKSCWFGGWFIYFTKPNNLQCLWILPLAALLVVGCGKKADPNKPIEEIKKEVETMSVADLQSTAEAYAKEISGKTGEMKKVQARIKDLQPKDLLGEKAKQIKDEVSEIGGQIKALTQRYDIYVKKFKAAGGDITNIKVE